MKKTKSKLTLKTETIRQLTKTELGNPHGGYPYTFGPDVCQPSYARDCHTMRAGVCASLLNDCMTDNMCVPF